ncbi:MAG: PEP-CTERM sorting domain-containing protein [Acidobacteriaceae bacterium]
MKLRAAILCLTAVTFLGASSFASSFGATALKNAKHGVYHPVTPSDSVLYSNGSDDGQQAYTINNTFSVTNSFTLGGTSTVNNATFSNWLTPGDTATSVDWLVTTAAFGGTTLGSGTASLTGVDQGINGFGFDVVSQTFSLSGLGLAAGTYFLQLQNEVVSGGDPGYWGESGGPSTAFDSALGQIPSESFSISGTGVLPPPIPEPSSLVLLGTGLLGAAGALRRKFSV